MKRVLMFLLVFFVITSLDCVYANTHVSLKFDTSKLAVKEEQKENGIFCTSLEWDTLDITSREGKFAYPLKKISYAIPFETRNVKINNISYSKGQSIKLKHELKRYSLGVSLSDINAYRYNKQDYNSQQPLPVLFHFGGLSQHSLAKEGTYKPMLQAGKRWNLVEYITGGHMMFMPKNDEVHEITYEVGEPVEIDEKTYYSIYYHNDLDIEYNHLVCYMREDCDLRQVWLRPIKLTPDYPFLGYSVVYYLTNWPEYYTDDSYKEEILLYDFANMTDWTAQNQWEYNTFTPEPKRYEFNDGIHNGFTRDTDIDFYEGIGAVESPEIWEELLKQKSTDLFGEIFCDITGNHAMTLLCSVIDPNGNPILEIDMHKNIRNWREIFNSLSDNEYQDIAIEMVDNKLKITASEPVGAITVSDMAGRVIIEAESDESYLELPLNGYSSGIYIVKTASTAQKIAVK